MEKTVLNDTQILLLNLFSYNMTNAELSELKKILVNYYNEKITKEATQIWQERNYNNDTIDQIAQGHFRKKKKVS